MPLMTRQDMPHGFLISGIKSFDKWHDRPKYGRKGMNHGGIRHHGSLGMYPVGDRDKPIVYEFQADLKLPMV